MAVCPSHRRTGRTLSPLSIRRSHAGLRCVQSAPCPCLRNDDPTIFGLELRSNPCGPGSGARFQWPLVAPPRSRLTPRPAMRPTRGHRMPLHRHAPPGKLRPSLTCSTTHRMRLPTLRRQLGSTGLAEPTVKPNAPGSGWTWTPGYVPSASPRVCSCYPWSTRRASQRLTPARAWGHWSRFFAALYVSPCTSTSYLPIHPLGDVAGPENRPENMTKQAERPLKLKDESWTVDKCGP